MIIKKKSVAQETKQIGPRTVEFHLDFPQDRTEYRGDLIGHIEKFKGPTEFFPFCRMAVTISRKEGKDVSQLCKLVLPAAAWEAILPDIIRMMEDLRVVDKEIAEAKKKKVASFIKVKHE